MAESVSDDFYGEFVMGGHCRMQCQCGRIHFDTTEHWDWEEGELEELQRLAERDDKYIDNPVGVHSILVGGVYYIEGCPCNYGPSLRVQIMNYLSKRITKEKARILGEDALVKQTSKLVEDSDEGEDDSDS